MSVSAPARPDPVPSPRIPGPRTPGPRIPGPVRDRVVRRLAAARACLRAILWAVLGAIAAGACSPVAQTFGPPVSTPRLGDGVVVAADGAELPLRSWPATGRPEAVIVALHGFNDYGNAFDLPGGWWARHGITTYAYDQRGFGATADSGIWPGTDNLVRDLGSVVAAVRDRHPGVPVFLAGESMGGAVIIAALAATRAGDSGAAPLSESVSAGVDGVVLAAPAVWGRKTMGPAHRALLWLSAHLAPAARVTGRGLGVTPSDNTEMLRALGRDPLVIKETRIDALYGLVDLMDEALAGSGRVSVPALVLYGDRDEIIPPRSTDLMLEHMRGDRRYVRYPDGYHMLFRDLQAETVWRDVKAWIEDRRGVLPSGHERPGTPGP